MAGARPVLAIHRTCAQNPAARDAVSRVAMLPSKIRLAICVAKAQMRNGSASTPNSEDNTRK